MGIDVHSLQILRRAQRLFGPLGHTATLGRLAVHLGPRAIKRWTGKDAMPGALYCEDLLQEHFGASHVDSIDNSAYEGASVVADLNLPLPDAFMGRYDSVLDFGCTEHIFDVGTSLRNIVRLCKVGGRILHAVPANGCCGHGFYQFSPELFFSWYSARNGFDQTEVYLADMLDTHHWYRVSLPGNGERVNVRSGGEVYVIVLTRRITAVNDLQVQQSDYVHVWQQPAVPRPPSRAKRMLALLREASYAMPAAARMVSGIDTALSPRAPKKLGRQRFLTRQRTDSLR